MSPAQGLRGELFIAARPPRMVAGLPARRPGKALTVHPRDEESAVIDVVIWSDIV